MIWISNKFGFPGPTDHNWWIHTIQATKMCQFFWWESWICKPWNNNKNVPIFRWDPQICVSREWLLSNLHLVHTIFYKLFQINLQVGFPRKMAKLKKAFFVSRNNFLCFQFSSCNSNGHVDCALSVYK